MRSESQACVAGLLLALLGCGPAVATTGGDEGRTTSASTSAADTADTTGGSTTPPPPATVTPTSASSTGARPSNETGPEPITGSSEESTGPLPPFPGEPDVQINVSCNVWEPECPERPELEKCIAWSDDESGVWNDARCTGVGPRGVGDACSVQGEPTAGIDNCDSGAMCWGVDPDTNDGHCAAQCIGTENSAFCDDPITGCVIGNDGSINICAQTCDPTAENCPEGEACYGDLNTGNTVCLRPGTPLVSGPDLLFPAFCPPGSTAVAPELDVNCEDGELCCAQWCDLDSVPQKCPGAVNCYPWLEDPSVVGTDDRGICLDVPSGP